MGQSGDAAGRRPGQQGVPGERYHGDQGRAERSQGEDRCLSGRLRPLSHHLLSHRSVLDPSRFLSIRNWFDWWQRDKIAPPPCLLSNHRQDSSLDRRQKTVLQWKTRSATQKPRPNLPCASQKSSLQWRPHQDPSESRPWGGGVIMFSSLVQVSWTRSVGPGPGLVQVCWVRL